MRLGTSALAERQGLDLFDAAVTGGDPVILLIPIDTPALRRLSPDELPPLLRGFASGITRRATASGTDPATVTGQLARLPRAGQASFILDLMRAQVAAVLGHDTPDKVDPEIAFKDLGFDSVAAVELRNRLNAATGVRLATTVVFNHPTPAALAGHLLARLMPGEAQYDAAMLADLDRLEADISALPGGSDAQAMILRRLRALVRRSEEHGEPGQAQGELELATDEELFAALDNELGGAA
jgi:acyl carrier protein